MKLNRRDFERLVQAEADALVRGLPGDLRESAEGIIFGAEDFPPEGLEEDLLGLYEGTPVGQRLSESPDLLPDRITLFRLPLLEMCGNLRQLKREIRLTLIHELGHHYGYEDGDLERRGLG